MDRLKDNFFHIKKNNHKITKRLTPYILHVPISVN